jgi:predicted ATPase
VVVRPSGVVTFLFTDIEGSTRRWESDAEPMRAELGAHDEVLSTAIEAHGGWLFKHTGDGVCAAFVSPKAAIDAAIDAQRGLALPVRMGIATGEAEPRGDDFFGPALNRAARVMGAGHGGQVLVAASTAALVSGVDLVDLGLRRLRDLSEPVRIFQLRAPGLQTEFRPVVTLDDTRGNLRTQSTSFFGRGTEMAAVATLLAGHRFVTLTGVGGVGKTRLGLQVAAQLAVEFPDGVWVFELAPVTDPAAVPDAVATELGIAQQAGMSVAESVANALVGRQRLLMFDNCEHVLDAAADLIEAILAVSTTVKILATSREGLRVADERLWPVPSLDIRDGVDSAGVALFVDRARALVPGFSLAGDSEGAVVEICQRLDGIPLAIELAAARMVSMTPTDVRDRLDDRFRLLAGGRRGLERHQTLRHAVQWSYDLLGTDERIVLDRCSVFAGGFDLDGATGVAGGDEFDEYAVLDVLDTLVRKSLVTADRSSGHVRYGFLETIRQFAHDQLAASGTSVAVHAAHAAYFAREATVLLDRWDGPRQREAYEWLERELDNLRAAWRWATDHDDLDTAATIAVNTTFVGFWVMVYEPIGWVEELLEPARTADHRLLAALTVMACLCCYVGRVDDGLRHSDNAIRLIDDPSYDPPPLGYAGLWVATPHIYAGRVDVSMELTRRDVDRIDDRLVLARPYIAIMLVLSGRVDEAISLADVAVTAAEKMTNPTSLVFALEGYGRAMRDRDPAAARRALQRAVHIAGHSASRYLQTIATGLLSELEAEHGDPAVALDLFTSSISGHYDAGNFAMARSPMAVLAVFLDRLGRHEPAAVIAGYVAPNPMTRSAYPELATLADHLGAVLGADRYNDLTDRGATMTATEAVHHAFAEIDNARQVLPAHRQATRPA